MVDHLKSHIFLPSFLPFLSLSFSPRLGSNAYYLSALIFHISYTIKKSINFPAFNSKFKGLDTLCTALAIQIHIFFFSRSFATFAVFNFTQRSIIIIRFAKKKERWRDNTAAEPEVHANRLMERKRRSIKNRNVAEHTAFGWYCFYSVSLFSASLF